jgi:hypothetical protein
MPRAAEGRRRRAAAAVMPPAAREVKEWMYHDVSTIYR